MIKELHAPGPKPRDPSHSVMLGRKPGAMHPEKGGGYNRGVAEAEEREIIAEEGDEDARITRIKDIFLEMQKFFGKDWPLVWVERNHLDLVGKMKRFLMEYNAADDTDAVRLQIAHWLDDLSK